MRAQRPGDVCVPPPKKKSHVDKRQRIFDCGAGALLMCLTLGARALVGNVQERVMKTRAVSPSEMVRQSQRGHFWGETELPLWVLIETLLGEGLMPPCCHACAGVVCPGFGSSAAACARHRHWRPQPRISSVSAGVRADTQRVHGQERKTHTHTDAERDTHARTHTHTAVHAHDSIPTTEARAGKLHICAHALAAELHENTHSAEDHIRLRRRHISCRHVAAAQLQ